MTILKTWLRWPAYSDTSEEGFSRRGSDFPPFLPPLSTCPESNSVRVKVSSSLTALRLGMGFQGRDARNQPDRVPNSDDRESLGRRVSTPGMREIR